MDNEIEVMRVIRIPPMGKLVVEVNGQRYERLDDVTNAALKQRLMTAVGELITFSNGYKTLVDAGVAPPLMAEQSRTAGEQSAASSELEARRAAFLSSLERERDALVAQADMTPDPTHLVSAAAKDDSLVAPEEPTSIVGQIDSILQKYVRAEPKLQDRSIHLEQAPAGGLRIKVDNEVYQRPAEIKEKEIQLVIKMALKEWESG